MTAETWFELKLCKSDYFSSGGSRSVPIVRTMGANNIFSDSWWVYNEGMFNFLNTFDCLVWGFFPAPDLNVRIIIPRFILLDWWTSTGVILLGANLTLISGGFLVLFYPPDTKLPWSAALMVKGTHAPLLYLTKIFCSTKVILVSWIIIFWSS